MARKSKTAKACSLALGLHFPSMDLKKPMKTTLLVLLILAGTAAFGQSAGVLSSVPQVISMPDHPMHADVTPMAAEHFLVGGGAYTVAHGERPLWEFGPVSEPARPLGDVARDVRKDKQSARRAEISLEKQGS
jgi:hypothetical protein